MSQQREQWGSRIGFILAAAGSAVGLGNIWKFPYVTGNNGGGAFILIYLVFAIFIGVTIMLAEFTLGRKTSLAAVGAFKSVSKNLTFVGVIGVLTALMIMGFYPVVGGWATAYIFKSFTGLTSNPEIIGDIFGGFITASVEPLIWTAIFLLANVLIVMKGIAGGIEKASKVLMPLLFAILIVISVYGLTLPGAMEGFNFLFVPDFSAVTANTFLAALGQAFFSLSLGMGCMVTYGSYLKKEENLAQNAIIVTALDTLCALLAGLAMFPALFAFGMEPQAGPGLVFIVVPMIFSHFGSVLGTVFSALFFFALVVAALTSSVSLLEVVAAYFIDQKGMKRPKAVMLVGAIMSVLAILSSLSLGVMAEFKILGAGVFDFLDLLTDKVFMTIGGVLIAIVVGWFVKKDELKAELTSGGTVKFALFEVWYFLIKFVAPIAIAIVAFMGIWGQELKGLMIAGIIFMVVLGLFSRKL